MSGRGTDDNLAYGSYHGQDQGGDGQEQDRGFVSDIYNSFTGRKPQGQQQQQPNVTQQYQPQLYGQQQQPGQAQPPFGSTTLPPKPTSSSAFSLGGLSNAIHSIGSDLKNRFASGADALHGHTHSSGQCIEGIHGGHDENRFFSFAPERQGNDAKWYIDAAGYMHAVSMALESARESIWILDWWLSPELYLRRPPAKNEQYRVDRMLQAAAERGVKVRIIVYKEVTQALTRKFSPPLSQYLHSLLPKNTDAITSTLTRLGLEATFRSLEYVEREEPLIEPPIAVSSYHTKHALEALHPNIQVFRHPDHLPDAQVLQSSFMSTVQNMKLTAFNASKLPLDALKAAYGVHEDTVLYWAHHEKLCVIDGHTAFMGGIDLCYGRWDTNQHSIADAHPGDLNRIVFPGQDYNNARIMDFFDVQHWQNNKLDRTQNSRMGWTDLSISLRGPAVDDLNEHFAQRWNFIYNEKYALKDSRYSAISYKNPLGIPAYSYPTIKPQVQQVAQQASFPPPPQPGAPIVQGQPGVPPVGSTPYVIPPPPAAPPGASQALSGPTPQASNQPFFPPPPTQAARGLDQTDYSDDRGFGEGSEEGERGFGGKLGGFRNQFKQKAQAGFQQFDSRYGSKLQGGLQQLDSKLGTNVGQYADQYLHGASSPYSSGGQKSGVSCQITRSCAKWSHGVAIEHSIANAYIEVIKHSQHFIYIENQFFITATSDAQKPVKNKIGNAIVERIVRAARLGQKFMVFVLMPAVPAFAGDLQSDDALSTRAIMEFQYDSISRGGNSIYQAIAQAGFNPVDYIRFYNLRNYDRINNSIVMQKAEAQAGFSYEDARKQHDAAVGGGFANEGSRGLEESDRGYQAYRPPGSDVPHPQIPAQPSGQGYNAYHPPGSTAQPPAPGAPTQYPPPPAPVEVEGSYPPPPSVPFPTQQTPVAPAPQDQIGQHGQYAGYPQGGSTTGYGEKPDYPAGNPYGQYQQAAQNIGDHQGLGGGKWDSVASCYMLGGEDIRNVPWEEGQVPEIEAFVSEELYIHSKLLIADDRVCIIGSANLNDRSQLGDHDSEIAVIVEDSATVESRMAGRPWQANRFAASLRRTLFRKHIGLLKPQDVENPTANFQPVGVSPNEYDWGSEEDNQVVDPLDDRFLNVWNTIAHTNTQVFERVFHPVPSDSVRNWQQYDEFYERYFRQPDSKAVTEKKKPAGKYKIGHVITENFPPGPEGIRAVKEELSKVKGTLVEMPLVFLKDEDIAKEGLGLNAFTAEVYT